MSSKVLNKVAMRPGHVDRATSLFVTQKLQISFSLILRDVGCTLRDYILFVFSKCCLEIRFLLFLFKYCSFVGELCIIYCSLFTHWEVLRVSHSGSKEKLPKKTIEFREIA